MSVEGEINRAIERTMPGTDAHRALSNLGHAFRYYSHNRGLIDVPDPTPEQIKDRQSRGLGPLEGELHRLLNSPYDQGSYVFALSALYGTAREKGFKDEQSS